MQIIHILNGGGKRSALSAGRFLFGVYMAINQIQKLSLEGLNFNSEKQKLMVLGGKKIEGEIDILGAKNSALPLICASLLTTDPIILENVPRLSDVEILGLILSKMGGSFAQVGSTLTIKNEYIQFEKVDSSLFRKMRASILALGPMLARYGEAIIPLPGGCAIGGRPIDIHLDGMKKMGADIELVKNSIVASAPKGLHGATHQMTFPSVGATENLMMAAVLAKGVTLIQNAAQEPEIVDLAALLKKMGAIIEGEGTKTISIQGVDQLFSARHRVVGDRIEGGSYLLLSLMNQILFGSKPLRVKGLDLNSLSGLSEILVEAGVEILNEKEALSVRIPKKLKGIKVKTGPFPDFPTDFQSQLMTLLTLADSESQITETIFENRFMHVPELIKMGAKIRTSGSTATITPTHKLFGATVKATDLRAGFSMVAAGINAKGLTLISDIHHIERGYESLVNRLTHLGAIIECLKLK